MDQLRKRRELERAKLHAVFSKLDAEYIKVPVDPVALEGSVPVIQALEKTLNKQNETIIDILLGDEQTTQEQLDDEVNATTELNLLINEVLVKIHRLLQPSDQPQGRSRHGSGGSGSTSSHRKSYKLPKIKLREFSGELKDWLTWWAQFEKIHDDEDLHDSDKFQYLDQCMVKGTRAAELVSSFPHTEDNYPKVVQALKDRFGNKKILKQIYVGELISMVVANRNKEKTSLSSLYDKLETKLRALESLGVSMEQMVIFLYPMVESSLPEDTLIAWQHSPNFGKSDPNSTPPRSELDYLLEFLKKEIEYEEQRKISRGGLDADKKIKQKKEGDEESNPTSAGLHNSTSSQCIFCTKTNHSSHVCFRAGRMTLEEKRAKCKENKACFWCLKPRHLQKCPDKLKCSVCNKRHVTLMCPGDVTKSKEAESTTVVTPTTQSTLNCTSEVVLRTLIVKIRSLKTNKWRKMRVLLDCGSQRSYILKKTAEDLGLIKVRTVTINHGVFGGGHIKNVQHHIYDTTIFSINQPYSTRVRLMDQDKICGILPRITQGPWKQVLEIRGIIINDVDNQNPREIELLIGADLLGGLLTGEVIQLENGLTATESRLGWCLMGQPQSQDSDHDLSVISMTATSATISELWKLETLGIRDPIEVKSQEAKDIMAYDHFRETVTRKEDGRYCVSLPWIDPDLQIPSNIAVAEKRLESTTKKLISLFKFSDYDAVFKSWEAEGIISEVNTEADGGKKVHYLPHRAVIKESKTTPIRPVFDASSKSGRAPSLNECLEKGPNLLEVIPAILLRFRMEKIGIIADIRKAFLMIDICDQDRNSLRFLWWDDPNMKKMKIYHHNRVVFGINCSPFILGAVINHHLSQKEFENPLTVKQLRDSLYVDNCVLSLSSADAYRKFKSRATHILAEAKMELRQWEWSGDNTIDRITNVLGLKWDKFCDTLFCAPLVRNIDSKITKKLILSKIQLVFDPLGFLSPVLLVPKILLQKSWLKSRQWDEEVTDEEKQEFQDWWDQLLPMLETFRLPRRCTGNHDGMSSFQLHMFSDASMNAYAGAVFLRVKSGSEVSVQLLQSKARVAPLKKPTIPRLELLSCSIAVRLANSVKKALKMEQVPITYWSDSTTALSWIRRNDDWGTFVGNRVREIVSSTTPEDWKYVPGHLNPADLPSRGIMPQDFLKLKWWEGPSWLKLEEDQWPSLNPTPNEEEVNKEKKRGTVSLFSSSDVHPWYIKKNSYIHSIHILGLVLRFIRKLKREDSECDYESTVQEIDRAELVLWKLVQSEVFPVDSKVIGGVRVIKGEDGLLRAITKLLHRSDTVEFRLPIIIPNSHPAVSLLIRDRHIFEGHAGIGFLVCNLRETFWILKSRQAVKREIRTCVICQRYDSKPSKVPSAALPENRVKDVKVFEVTGIDLTGPLVLRDESKVWIVLYTCAVYRAVHLEVVDGLSTEDFLLSIVRFCKRKRRPVTVYTDCGTNFKGAITLFKKID